MSSALAPIIIISVLSIQFLLEMLSEKLLVILFISLVQVLLGHFENCNFSSLHPEGMKPQQEPLSDHFLLSELMLKPALAKLKAFSPHTTYLLCPFIFHQKPCARTHSSYQNMAGICVYFSGPWPLFYVSTKECKIQRTQKMDLFSGQNIW